MAKKNVFIFSTKEISGDWKRVDNRLSHGFDVILIENNNSGVPQGLCSRLITRENNMAVALEACGILSAELLSNQAEAIRQVKKHKDLVNRIADSNYWRIVEKIQKTEAQEAKLNSFSFLGEVCKVFVKHEDHSIDAFIENYVEDKTTKTVSFTIRNWDEEITFEMLCQISDILGTRKINLSDSVVVNDGCNTCGHGKYTQQPIYCWEVKFPSA